MSSCSGYSGWGWSGNSGMRGEVVAWTEYADDSHFNIVVTGHTQCSEGCGAGWDMQSQVGFNGDNAGIGTTWCTEGHYFESVTNGWADYHKEVWGPFSCSAVGKAITVWYKCWATGGWGGGQRDAFATLIAPQYRQRDPRPPKGLKVARKSDSSQQLTWAGDYTGYDGLYAWDRVYVERRCDNGSFVQLAKLNWDATNWTDNSTAAGHRYTYRMRAENSGDGATKKYSPYTSEVTVFTTPGALGALAATKADASSVTLAGTGLWAWRDEVKFQVRQNGGDWSDASLATLDSSTWVDAAAPAGTVSYRARAGVKQGGSSGADNVLYGPWRESNEVVTICAPNAPAVSLGAGVVPLGDDVSVSWVPSHPDGTEQSAAQAVLCDSSGTQCSAVSVEGATAAAAFTTTSLSLGTYLVRVRTKGLSDDWGAWSDYATVVLAAYPVAAITCPASDYPSTDAQGKLPISVEWSASCRDGIAYQVLSVLDANGSAMSEQRLDADARSASLGFDVGFENESSYTIRLEVYGGGGLTSAAERAILTEWLLPHAAVASIVFDDDLAAWIRVTSPTDEGTTDGESSAATAAASDGSSSEELDIVDYDLARVDPDGTRTALGEHLLLGFQVEDPLPPLNTGFTYEVTTRSSLETVNVKSFPVTCDSRGMEAFNFGPAAQVCVLMGLDADSSEDFEVTGESYDFALGSDTPLLPTFYPDGTLDASRSLSYKVHDRDTYEQVRSIARNPAYACFWYRDHWGHRMYCHGKWSTGYSAKSYSLWDVSVSPEEVVWREPVNG